MHGVPYGNNRREQIKQQAGQESDEEDFPVEQRGGREPNINSHHKNDAVSDQQDFIPVRLAFISRTSRFDVLSPLIRSLRYKHKSFSPNIYHTNPFDIRRLKIERSFRTRENAYTFTKKKNKLAEPMRSQLYEELYQSMKKHGFDDRHPIEIMLCRSFGVQDTVDQGHHRMSVAIDCKLSRIAVRFGAAGKAPNFLRPLFLGLAKACLFFKH